MCSQAKAMQLQEFYERTIRIMYRFQISYLTKKIPQMITFVIRHMDTNIQYIRSCTLSKPWQATVIIYRYVASWLFIIWSFCPLFSALMNIFFAYT